MLSTPMSFNLLVVLSVVSLKTTEPCVLPLPADGEV